jgi:hypothetical protein
MLSPAAARKLARLMARLAFGTFGILLVLLLGLKQVLAQLGV